MHDDELLGSPILSLPRDMFRYGYGYQLLASGYTGCTMVHSSVQLDSHYRNNMLARNKSTHHAYPAIKGARHWSTKGAFFENVIFLGILLSVQKVYSNLQVNRFFGISLSTYTEIVLKNVLSRSKNPPGTPKFARKLSSTHARVTIHRNSTQKHN